MGGINWSRTQVHKNRQTQGLPGMPNNSVIVVLVLRHSERLPWGLTGCKHVKRDGRGGESLTIGEELRGGGRREGDEGDGRGGRGRSEVWKWK